eukprot:2594210-Rhodomonas_salina.1
MGHAHTLVRNTYRCAGCCPALSAIRYLLLLSATRLLRRARALHACYAKSGTDIAYGAIRTRLKSVGSTLLLFPLSPTVLRSAPLSAYAMSAICLRDVRYLPTRCPLSADAMYTVSGTDMAVCGTRIATCGTPIVYGATQYVALRQRMARAGGEFLDPHLSHREH